MDISKRASEILKIQQNALQKLKITPVMLQAIEKIATMKASGGRIITTGMGKAGIIATKMSATLSSVGLPSFFVSPAEAGHGDVGRITTGDLVIAFSHSGSTAEVVSMIETVQALNEKTNEVIVISSNQDPVIPADLVVCYGNVQESCVVSKVPSTSTTLMLVVADILAITAAECLGLDDETFKARHPGGAIGQSYKVETK
ncbi:MAG TPA: SIS domain-containing protein [Candidatus Lokiarchaeia archaeon]|nr:SIS domain-containing protein [Candidatus Lokiarchaeia archaeon]